MKCVGKPIAAGSCPPAIDLGPRPKLATIIRAYISRYRPGTRDELAGFRDERNRAAAIKRAGMAERSDGKRYSHQRRLPKALLKAATAELQRAKLGTATDFDDLHNRVERAIGCFVGIGELMVYDTSLRVGAHLGLLPSRVYLHRGTRVGARALGLDWRAKSVGVRDCPRELRVLKAHEIEDCLCIFEDKFKRERTG